MVCRAPSLKAISLLAGPILPAPASPPAVEATSIAPAGCRQRSARATTRSMPTSSLALALIARVLHPVLCVKATVIPMRTAWAISPAFSAAAGKQSQDVEAQSLEMPVLFNIMIFAMNLLANTELSSKPVLWVITAVAESKQPVLRVGTAWAAAPLPCATVLVLLATFVLPAPRAPQPIPVPLARTRKKESLRLSASRVLRVTIALVASNTNAAGMRIIATQHR